MNTRARRCGFTAAHLIWASRAFSTAARTSSTEARATEPFTSPVMGQ